MTRSSSAGAAGRRDVLLLTIGFAALVVVAGVSIWLAGRTADFGDQVARTLETKTEIIRTLSLAQDAETGQRGYLLTEDERYLGPYSNAVAQMKNRLDRLRELSRADTERTSRLNALDRALKLKFEELAETVELQKAGKVDEARALVETDRGRNAMREVRRLVAEMSGREDQLFAQRTASLSNATTLQIVVVILGLALAAGLAFFAQLLVRRQASSLEAAQAELAAKNAQLGEINVGLEATVAERMADLVAANQEIQRFAYIVSHDLRAPLVNVMGFTSELDAARRTLKAEMEKIAEDSPGAIGEEARLAVDEDLPEALGFIRASTSKMDRLINAILQLSREGRRVVTPETVSPAELAESIGETMEQQLQAADAKIVVEGDVPTLISDKMAVEQVFQNLLENAVKYLDRSRPGRIVVRGRRAGLYVEYEIEDNGRGIDPKDHERVFELFRRAGVQDQPGEGLGLAFVRATMRRLGGRIGLTSEPGKGSTFILTFPAVLTPDTERRAA